MVQAILVWSGAVLAIVVLLLMALGPVIVEVDSWWYERKHSRKRSTVAAAAGSPASVRSVDRVAHHGHRAGQPGVQLVDAALR